MVGGQGGSGGEPATSPGVAATTARPFRATTGLKYLAGFFGGGIGLSAIYAVSGQGIPCPFRSITGWECPLCGGTRLGGALLQGEVAAAFAYNPVIFIGLIALAVVSVAWIVEALGGPRVRPPVRIAAALRTVTPTRWLVVGLVLSLLFVLARNLL